VLTLPPSRSRREDTLEGVEAEDGKSFTTQLRQLIRSGTMSGGDRLPSERRLADQFRLPRAVVRASLGELEREGLLECLHGSGRQVASVSRRLDRGVVAVVTSADLSLTHLPDQPPWSNYQAAAAMTALQRREQTTMVIHPRRLMDNGARWLADRDVVGLLVMQMNTDEWDLGPILRDAHAAGANIVAYGNDAANVPWDCVTSGHAAGAAMLTRWLLAHGRRRILRFWRFAEPRPWRLERDEGFEHELAAHGLDPLPAVITASPIGSDRSALQQADEYEALIAMIMGFLYPYVAGERAPIDAVMCATDRHALEVSDALKRLGATPNRDVAVVGYDNSYPYLIQGYPGATPPAATVEKSNDLIGHAMCDLLLERLRGELPPEPQTRTIEPSLVVPGVNKQLQP